MGVVTGTSAPRVFDFFEKLASIPHGSGNTAAISSACVSFAEKRGLRYRRDAANNVIIWKEASPGRKNESAVMLQGHLDMVAVAEDGKKFDFQREGLSLHLSGDWLSAEGTTLGGDDGIAVAMCLAVLDDDTISHPPLICVFTADEEIGMLGAGALDMSDLDAKYMLNLDCEQEGSITVSCAGGATLSMQFPVSRQMTGGIFCGLRVSGLPGGHSGTEITCGYTNAIRHLAGILEKLKETAPVFLTNFSGGAADNAIPASSWAEFLIPAERREDVLRFLETEKKRTESELREKEPGYTLEYFVQKESCQCLAASEAAMYYLTLITALPNGLQAMSRELPGLAETSLNLGIARMTEDTLSFTYSVRSSRNDAKQAYLNLLREAGVDAGGNVRISGEYPGWPLLADSPLQRLAANTWKRLFGSELVTEAIHAGLECGIFASRIPGLDIIAFGPDILDIHSPKERLSVSSTERTFRFLTELLKDIHA